MLCQKSFSLAKIHFWPKPPSFTQNRIQPENRTCRPEEVDFTEPYLKIILEVFIMEQTFTRFCRKKVDFMKIIPIQPRRGTPNPLYFRISIGFYKLCKHYNNLSPSHLMGIEFKRA